MSFAPKSESEHHIKRLVQVQVVVAAIVFVPVAYRFGLIAAASVFSGLLLVVATGWHTRRELERTIQLDAEQGKRVLLKSAGVRFVAVLLALFSAYVLGLHLLWLAAGFFIGQLVSYSFFLRMFYQQQRA